MAAIDQATPLVLGSASPRRRELLAGLGLPISVLPASLSEERFAGEAPLVYLERIVEEKLVAVRARLDGRPHAALLVADTIVVLDDDVLGKPTDRCDAERLLGRLAGRTHAVFTRYALFCPEPGSAGKTRTVESKVTLRAARQDELARYAGTGEGLDKAGAYAAQGIGAFLVERIEGSYTNVIGLPICELVTDLEGLGVLPSFP